MDTKDMIEVMKWYEDGGWITVKWKNNDRIAGAFRKTRDGRVAWNWEDCIYEKKVIKEID